MAADNDVRILGLRLDRDLEEVLGSFRPHVVAITGYTVHANAVIELFDAIRRRSPKTLTVVGGHHATVVAEDYVSPSSDLIVLGEGVFTFR